MESVHGGGRPTGTRQMPIGRQWDWRWFAALRLGAAALIAVVALWWPFLDGGLKVADRVSALVVALVVSVTALLHARPGANSAFWYRVGALLDVAGALILTWAFRSQIEIAFMLALPVLAQVTLALGTAAGIGAWIAVAVAFAALAPAVTTRAPLTIWPATGALVTLIIAMIGRELRHDADRNRALLAVTPDATLFCDALGNILGANAAAVHQFRCPIDELVGRPIEAFVPTEARERHRAHRARFVDEPSARPMGSGIELSALRADGTTFDADVALGYWGSGRSITTIASVRDVTLQRMAMRELRESHEALRRSGDHRRQLLQRIAAAEDHERRRLSSELHDSTIQQLTAAKLTLERSADLCRTEEAHERLRGVIATLGESLDNLRNLMFRLRPPTLDRTGLGAAVEDLFARSPLSGSARLSLVDEIHGTLPDRTATTAYRIIGEALTNVWKHAEATRIDIELRERRGGLELTVSDDGCGFEEQDVPSDHIGLATMRERAESLGGSLCVSSTPGEGTTVRAWLPLVD